MDLAIDGSVERLGHMHPQCRQHPREIPFDIDEGAGQTEVDEHIAQRPLEASLTRVVGPVARRLAVKVVGGHARANEDEVVMEVGAMQHLGADRVEEGLGQFGLAVFGQQAHILALDLLPVAGFEPGGTELPADALDRFAHPRVIELDALAGKVADRMPVGRLVAGLGLLGVVAKQRVVTIEANQDRLGDCRRFAAFGTVGVVDQAVGGAPGRGHCFRHRLSGSHRKVRVRSACGGSRRCRRQSHTAWHRATVGRSDSR